MIRRLSLALLATGLMIVLSQGALAATFSSSTASAATRGGVCPRTVVSLVNALTAIDGRLDVGVSYSQFQELLSRAHVADVRIAAGTGSYACIQNVGLPAERALNAYSHFYKSWSRCLDWYDSAENHARLQFGFKSPTCENGPGHDYEARQQALNVAHDNVRRATNALG